jgi:hypothetical protein
LRVFGEHLGQGLPEAQGPVADREDGGAHAPAGAVAHRVGPGLARLTVAVLERNQFLGAVGAHCHMVRSSASCCGSASPKRISQRFAAQVHHGHVGHFGHRLRLGAFAQAVTVRVAGLLHRRGQDLQQVPPVGHFRGVRGGFPDLFYR